MELHCVLFSSLLKVTLFSKYSISGWPVPGMRNYYYRSEHLNKANSAASCSQIPKMNKLTKSC